MTLDPYVFFDGRAEEALGFYKRTIRAQVQALMRFKECPNPKMVQPGTEEKVMHAHVRIGNSTLLVSDGECRGKGTFQGFALSLNVSSEAEADRVFAALSEGGQVQMPLAKTFFSNKFGMLKDRFGVSWMVYMPPDQTNH